MLSVWIRVAFTPRVHLGTSVSTSSEKPIQHVGDDTRNVVVPVVVQQAAAESDQAGGEHSAARRGLEIHHVGSDQLFHRLSRPVGEMGEHLLGDHDKVVAVILRAREDTHRFNEEPNIWMTAIIPGRASGSSMAVAIISRTVS